MLIRPARLALDFYKSGQVCTLARHQIQDVRTSAALMGLNRSVHSALRLASATAAGLTSTFGGSAVSVLPTGPVLAAAGSRHIRRLPSSAEVAAAPARSAWQLAFGGACHRPGKSAGSGTSYVLCIRKAEHQFPGSPTSNTVGSMDQRVM